MLIHMYYILFMGDVQSNNDDIPYPIGVLSICCSHLCGRGMGGMWHVEERMHGTTLNEVILPLGFESMQNVPTKV